MISDSTLKSIQNYLSCQNGINAIVDLDFSVIWESSEGFLENLDLNPVCALLPIQHQQIFSLNHNGSHLSLSVIPIYRSKKQIGAYTVKILTEEENMERLNATSLNSSLRQNYEIIQYELNNTINLNQLALDKSTEDNTELLIRQASSINRMLVCNTNLLAVASLNNNAARRSLVSITDILDDVASELKKEMEVSERKLAFRNSDCRLCAEVYEKSFVLAFMNLVHYALIYAPLNSKISISVKADKEKISIAISNSVKEQSAVFERNAQAEICMDTAYRLVKSDCGGFVETNTTNSRMITKIILKRISDRTEPKSLDASYKDYIAGKFQPVHLFVNEIIKNEKEEQEI